MKINKQKIPVLFCLVSAVLLIAINIFIFSTFDIFRENPSEFEVGYRNMLHPLLKWGGLFMFAGILPGLVFSRTILTRYASFMLMLGILTWIQAGMLIWDYGVFDGRNTNWDQYDALGWMDIGLWLGLLIISLRYAGRVLAFANVVAWILIFGQTFLLLGEGTLKQEDWVREYYPSSNPPEEIFKLSRRQNIAHFVLDSMQTDVFLELIEDLDLRDEFEGFTLFYENVGVAPHTSLAIPAIFSGEIFDASQPPSSYYKGAMTNGFQNELFDAGYTVNLIPQLSMLDSNYSNYYRIPSTYKGTVKDLVTQNAAQLLDVALFRSAPHFLRKAIHDDGNWFLLPTVRGDMQVRSFQEKVFFKDYTQGLKPESATPAYHFMHLTPPHPPYVTLADGHYAGSVLPNTRENYLNESRAIIELIVQYIEKLKSLGVYDEAMIILQGDHGSQIYPEVNGESIRTCVSRMPALLAVKPPGGKYAMQVSYAPTSLLDVAPTALSVLGDAGRSVFALDDSVERQRPFIIFDGKSAVARIVPFTINGSVFDPKSCKRGSPAEIISGTSRYVPGSEIQFGMTGDADAYMGGGWSPCQADYCWTTGPLAEINLPTDKASSDLLLKVRFKPYINEEKLPQQRIRVSVNGTQLAEWLVSRFEFQSASLRIPAELAQEDTIRIAFHFPDAISPKTLNIGADARVLGIAAQTLQIDVLNND